MIEYRLHTVTNTLTTIEKERLTRFLHLHLDQYGDKLEDISKAVEYANDPHGHKGGFILEARKGDTIVGAVVVNKTGMSGYIPENVLVYIAVNQNERGQGIGMELMKKALENARGDIALHVEPDNPARKLYEKLGFTNKYLEMRYTSS
jgi:GNAT superfamily N-acetyltransferase